MSRVGSRVGDVASRPPSSPVSVTVQFVLAGIVWGSSFLFIAVALTGMTPAQVAGGRLFFGAVTLAAIVAIRRERLPRGRRIWAHLCLLGLTFCAIPFLLFAWAEQHVPSGLASIFNATTPIMTAIMAWAVFRVESLKVGQLTGIAVGIVGVVVIIAPGAVGDIADSTVAQLALLGATACYGFSLAYMRRFLGDTGLSGISLAFGYIAPAALLMVLLSPVILAEPMRLTPPVVGSIVTLGVLGTGFAYVWNQNVLRAWGPTRASTVTYITPVVGVALGILILGERISWNEPVGAAVVFAGILLVQQRIRLPHRART